MGETDTSAKREHAGGGGGRDRRKKRRKYKQFSNTVTRKDIPKGSRGFLISCNPKHEVQTFHDAQVLFDKHVDVDIQKLQTSEEPEAHETDGNGANNASASAEPKAQQSNDAGADTTESRPNEKVAETTPAPGATEANAAAPPPDVDVNASLQKELAELKAPVDKVLFQRVDVGVKGVVFVRVNDESVQLETVVESVLAAARQSGEPGCRFCQKILPIHETCYASPEDAAATATRVAEKHFPDGDVKFAIMFKSRANNKAHRDEYIKVIAAALEKKFGSRLKVDLTEPDVVLIAEVIKSSCAIGSFRKFFELAKCNVREAAKPPKEKKKSTKVDGDSGKKTASVAAESKETAGEAGDS